MRSLRACPVPVVAVLVLPVRVVVPVAVVPVDVPAVPVRATPVRADAQLVLPVAAVRAVLVPPLVEALLVRVVLPVLVQIRT